MTNIKYEEQKVEHERKNPSKCEQGNHDWMIMGNYDSNDGATVTCYMCRRCGKESEERSW